MANINSASAVPFIPEIWANMALEILRSNSVLAGLVTKDSDVASFQVGSKLHIPYPGTFVANDKATNTAVTKQVPTSTDTTVTLNKHKEVSFVFEDFARAQAQPITMQAYVGAMVAPLVDAIESDLFGLYPSFTSSIGAATTPLTAATVRLANKTLTDNRVPRTNRNLVITTGDTQALLADASLQSFFAFNEGARNDISSGLVASNLYGFKVYESQLVPLATSNKNLAFDPGAIILAMRALPEAPGGTGAAQAVVHDPTSGLVLRSTLSYNADNLGVQCTLDVLYGVAKLRNEKAVVVLT
jgi:hypothetical protein